MKSPETNFIVVSKEDELPRRIETLFTADGFSVVWEPDLDRVRRRFESETFDVLIITSVVAKTEKIDCIELIDFLTVRSPVTQILFLVASDDIDMAMSGLKVGAYQYAKLPVSDEELQLLVKTAFDQRPSFGTNLLLKNENGNREYRELVGQSPAMQKVYEQIQQAAATDIPVLLQGETGTGKDLVAEVIHRQSARCKGSFIPVNLGALPVELVGSELFGHEKGAFTGAVDLRKGKFELGNEGTVFLDEIGTIDEKMQVSLLRLIEQKKFHRLGGRRLISVDVRLIAASNEEIVELVRQGVFREDLFYRLDVFRLELPPVQKRQGDIPLLIDAFLSSFNQLFRKNVQQIDRECAELLEAYKWPGNVRELKNVIQRAVLVCEGEEILPEHLPPRFRRASRSRLAVSFEVGTPLYEVEREMIIHTLSANENNRKRTAELLGISRRSLYNKLSKYGIG